MTEIKLDASREKVAFLMDNIPEARYNYLYLLLSYWQIFDGIEIPEHVVAQIIENGTSPETVGRARRKTIELAAIREIIELQRLAQVMEEVEGAPHTI